MRMCMSHFQPFYNPSFLKYFSRGWKLSPQAIPKILLFCSIQGDQKPEKPFGHCNVGTWTNPSALLQRLTGNGSIFLISESVIMTRHFQRPVGDFWNRRRELSGACRELSGADFKHFEISRKGKSRNRSHPKSIKYYGKIILCTNRVEKNNQETV